MINWKKISLIATLVILLLGSGFGTAAWIFNKGGQSSSVIKNANMAPIIAEDLREHKEGDNKKAIIDSMKNIQMVTAINGLADAMKELNENVKENNRLMQYAKFTYRK